MAQSGHYYLFRIIKQSFTSLKTEVVYESLIKKYGLKNEATSNVEIKEILQILNISCGIYMRDDTFYTKSGIVILHPTKGKNWVMYTNEYCFDSFGCPPPLSVMNHINKGIYSEYEIQKNEKYCAGYCLCVSYVTNIIGF